jgi:DNA-binding CsgD family transcriptional regulator
VGDSVQHRRPKTPSPRAPKTELTKGERKVLDRLLARPLDSNQDIADTLGCTVKNVEFHMSNILRKTKTASRMELVMKMIGGKQREDDAGTERS